ncbi:MAG: DUF4920 domain-containing protein [Sedimentisphaerales bacterium]|nr:DUF4920 domain-containing protein [Sedimentisphaerales bacterium]
MKTRNVTSKIWFVVLTLSMILTLSSCGKKKPEQYGQQIGNRDSTQIKAVLKEPETFSGKTVTIEGKIVSECNTGCWFDVQGPGGVIHVDIKPSGFAIPQKVGKEVMVEGNVSLRDGQLTLIGKGVEMK